MTDAVQVLRRVVLLGLLLVLLGSGTILAGVSDSTAPAAVKADPNAATVAKGGLAPSALAKADPDTAAPAKKSDKLSLGTVQEVLNRIYGLLAEYGLRIVGALLIFVIGRWVAKVLSSLAAKGMKTAKVDATLVPFLENLAYSGLLIFVVIAALGAVGVETASVIAVLGAAGLAVGLALQGSLANFASGVLLLVFKPFRVGDFVEVGGVKGKVQAIHVFNTVLDSPDNIRIIVPNGQVAGASIMNYTANATRRVDLVASISYEDDMKKAKKVIESVLAQEKRILPEPAPLVVVGEMGDSSIDFYVRPWVKTADYWPVYFDLTEKLKTAIEEHGMTIPFPQQEITIKSAASAANVKSA